MKKCGLRALTVLTVGGIILLLLLIGPVNALIMRISISNSYPNIGDLTSIIASAKVQQMDTAAFNNFTIMISGPQIIQCTFFPNGTLLTSCPGITIKTINQPQQAGYGYYEPGSFEFNITLNTSQLTIGNYDVTLKAHTSDGTRTSPKQTLKILKQGQLTQSCSIRASNGVGIFNNQTFQKNNHLSVNVPLKNAKDGQGSITLQDKSSRVSYEFSVLDAYSTSNKTIIFDVTGNMRKDLGNKLSLTGEIIFDKTKMKISFVSPTLNANNMGITFAKC